MTAQSEHEAQLIAIIGPTASGKSALALALANEINAEILSADSMQVYRGMDIGTSKPTAAERTQVRHRLIDLVDPNESFTVAMFVNAADEAIRDAAARNRPLVVTGGTPLYYKALFEGLFEGPSADADIRARLASEPVESLHQRLERVDPIAAQRIHVNDRKRLIRALEVFELTGQPISSFQTEWQSRQPRYRARWFGLSWPRDAINQRINARVKQMIAAGWVEEARGLLARFGQLSNTAAEATGYAEIIQHLQGRISLDDAVEHIKIATRQLARRQMKWFRRFENVKWLEGERDANDLVQEVLTFIRQ